MSPSPTEIAGADVSIAVSVRFPLVVGVIGPEALVSRTMTVVELSSSTMSIEGSLSLAPGQTVALAIVLPADPPGAGAPVPILALAVVAGRGIEIAASSWRTPLRYEQIESTDAARLATFVTQEHFRHRSGDPR
jgi:hypothetical protein